MNIESKPTLITLILQAFFSWHETYRELVIFFCIIYPRDNSALTALAPTKRPLDCWWKSYRHIVRPWECNQVEGQSNKNS